MTQSSRNSQAVNRPWFDRDLTIRCCAGASLAVASASARPTVGDWPFFLDISKRLFGGNGLRVFGEYPNIQTGPLSLLAVRLSSLGPLNARAVRAVIFFGIAMAVVELLIRVRRTRYVSSTSRFVALPAVVLAMFWWTYFESYGHLDDALVVACFATALLLRTRGKWTWMGVVLGLAIAVKPWSVLLLPIGLAPSGRYDRRLRPVGISVVVAGCMWAPFVVAAPSTLAGMKPNVKLARDSVLTLFHVEDAHFSAGLRIIQLGLALLVALVGVRRDRAAGILMGGVAIRIALDPATWRYYTTSLIIGAVFWDVCQSRQKIPMMTMAVSALMAPAWLVPDANLRAIGRLLACILCVSVIIWPHERRALAPQELSIGDAEVNDLAIAL